MVSSWGDALTSASPGGTWRRGTKTEGWLPTLKNFQAASSFWQIICIRGDNTITYLFAMVITGLHIYQMPKKEVLKILQSSIQNSLILGFYIWWLLKTFLIFIKSCSHFKTRGLRLGLYSSAGVFTCSGFLPGSLAHERCNANFFFVW